MQSLRRRSPQTQLCGVAQENSEFAPCFPALGRISGVFYAAAATFRRFLCRSLQLCSILARRTAHFDVPFAQSWFLGIISQILNFPFGYRGRFSGVLVVFCMHFHPFVLFQYNLSFLVL